MEGWYAPIIALRISRVHPAERSIGGITMHPLRKLREAGKPTLAQISELLAENIVFNSPILARPIQGRELIAPIFTQSSNTRGSGTYTPEFKLDEGDHGGPQIREYGDHRRQRAGVDCGTHYCPPALSRAETVPR